ncbi:MAG: D-tyrosyl-tRNA(Tyr) deacylase [Clostridiales bacterium]|nr:D-tyrosyl-tRNA(Tyr) deacylase [Clostridiales bacterium]
MKLVVQRVSHASVTVDGEIVGKINEGLMILIGAKKGDTEKDVEYCVEKALNLRIFSDENDKMNLSVKDINGELLLISQFTLYGNTSHGRRPDFIEAEEPVRANELYELFVEKAKQSGLKVQTGVFRADMKVELLNNGPVTLIVESKS